MSAQFIVEYGGQPVCFNPHRSMLCKEHEAIRYEDQLQAEFTLAYTQVKQ